MKPSGEPMDNRKLPPFVSANDNVILFDGVCRLCQGWSRFIIRYDRHQVFRLAPVQSEQGRAILQYFGLPTDHFETMLFVQGGDSFEKSTAFLKIIRLMPYPFRLLFVFRYLPLKLRDWLYDRIALNRYRLFGKYGVCLLPHPDHDKRFL